MSREFLDISMNMQIIIIECSYSADDDSCKNVTVCMQECVSRWGGCVCSVGEVSGVGLNVECEV